MTIRRSPQPERFVRNNRPLFLLFQVLCRVRRAPARTEESACRHRAASRIASECTMFFPRSRRRNYTLRARRCLANRASFRRACRGMTRETTGFGCSANDVILLPLLAIDDQREKERENRERHGSGGCTIERAESREPDVPPPPTRKRNTYGERVAVFEQDKFRLLLFPSISFILHRDDASL